MYKKTHQTVMLLCMLCLFVTPVESISVFVASGDAGVSVSSSTAYELDDSSSLDDQYLLNSAEIYQKRLASGSGINSLRQNVNDGENSLFSDIGSDGQFSSASICSVSSDSIAFDQDVIGNGNLDTVILGEDGTNSAGQQSSVSIGIMKTRQSFSAGDQISASQQTAMVGMEGRIAEGMIIGEDAAGYIGDFLGASEMNAALTASTGDSEDRLHGSISIDGATYFDEANMKDLASTSGGKSVEGLQASEFGMSRFNIQAFNVDKSYFESMNGGSGSEDLTTNAGSHTSYSFWGKDGYPTRWNTDDPVQLYLNDLSLAGTGIDSDYAKSAITDAANTWDGAVAKNLFADGETIKSSGLDPKNNQDGFNVHGWAPLDGLENGKVPLARTYNRWDDPKVDECWSMKESDVIYNNQVSWYYWDLQTVALHELGHAIGMYHVDDPSQIMYPEIEGVERNLGVGDIYGAQQLYGAGMGLVGDYNGDGKSDIIEINGEDNIITSLSEGNGLFSPISFTPWAGYGTGLGGWAVSDVNGDGKDDLQHVWGGDYINLWISNGDGTYQMKSFQPWPGYGTSLGLWEVADVNGDGKDDLQHMWGGDYINTWVSNGDGTYQMRSFQPWQNYGISLGDWMAADVNGDNKDDLQHIWGGDYINTWISNGDGTYQMRSFQPWPGYGTSLGGWGAGDINGDGKDDLQHVWGGDYINTWISNGDGTYQMKSFQPWPGYGSSLGIWTVADVTGDGKDDLQHIWGGDYINNWISNGDGTYQMKSYQPWPGYDTAFAEYHVADYDGDGLKDILHLFGGDYPIYYLWKSNGDGTFTI